MTLPSISLITFLPLIGAILLIFIPGERKEIHRLVAFIVSLITFVFSILLFIHFDSNQVEPQFVENTPWLGYGINYHVGLDGLSLLLVMLTTFLFPIVILSGWRYIDHRVKEYHLFLLFLETGIIGVFVSLNLFLFYVFWEVMLIPMYFLIGLWGGPRRIYATIKFIIFTMAGSLLMLVAIFVLYNYYYQATGSYSFEIADLTKLILLPKVQTWLFLAFALAFAIKVPLFPFHTWLPDAHVEAPTAGSVILAAVLLKMGVYGFLRLAMPLFPQALIKFTPLLMILSVIGIIYGGCMALIQKDVKSLVAYSSVSHMGLIMLALFSLNQEGLQGSILQMINHGLSTGALFLIVGILYERAHTRLIKDFGGVSRQMPVLAAFFLIFLLSSAGLPGLNGFIGEILCLFGIFRVNKVMAYLAVTTVILAAAYLLWMYQRVMHGPIIHDHVRSFKDVNLREIVYLGPIVILMFWIGFYPNFFLKKMDSSVAFLLKKIEEKQKYFVFEGEPQKGFPLKLAIKEKSFSDSVQLDLKLAQESRLILSKEKKQP
ncbi:MAG: NADH-quinone oxidoreductase subunit M [Candidatus Aminicenantes bacterium]|nr:NADH-quinone oxidoreductase subunit M [Candidatus Aminicenantes bacterium]